MRSLGLTIFAGCCILCSSAAGQTKDFKVTQFPEATYFNEQNTFVVKAEPGTVVEVYLADKKIASDSSDRPVRELNMSLPDSGMLKFQNGQKSISFHVVKPSDGVRLRERDGYLHSGTSPAILLAEHCHPPKHSRKWEVVTVLLRCVRDMRPKTTSGIMMAADVGAGVDVRAISTQAGFPSTFWRHVDVSNTLSRINGFVERMDGLEQADVVVLALSGVDLERGISELALRIKLEWCLQVLCQRECSHVFVVSPPLARRQDERFPDIRDAVKMAADGNHAHASAVFSTDAKRPISTKDWVAQVTAGLARIVRWERR